MSGWNLFILEVCPLLEMTGISKNFDAVRALSHASLQVNAGEIMALLGSWHHDGVNTLSILNACSDIADLQRRMLLVSLAK